MTKGKDEEVRHLAGSVVKVTKDGERVLSDNLGPGERLASEVDAEAEEKAAKAAAKSKTA